MLFREEFTTNDTHLVEEDEPRGRATDDLLQTVMIAIRRSLGDYNA